MSDSSLTDLGKIGRRFQGVDLQYRREGTGWPEQWRARLFASKNERYDYRLVAFGETADAAVAALVTLVADADAANLIWFTPSSKP
jgi:hypothetical protein